MKKIAIIGSNDLGILIAYHARNMGMSVAGFFDNKKEKGTVIQGFGEVLGGDSAIQENFDSGLFEFLFVGVGYTQFSFRQYIFEKYSGKIPFCNIVHPSSYVDSSVSLGKGMFILPGVVLDMNVKISDNVVLNTGCVVAHDSEVMQHTFIGPGVTIAGNSKIGACNFIGVGSTILDGVDICDKTIVGGGAVVTSSISSPGVYVGIPAKKMKENTQFVNQ